MNKSVREFMLVLVALLAAVVPAAAQTQSSFEWKSLSEMTERKPALLADGSTYKTHGAIAGFIAGAGITALVVHSGGSTSLCDRNANQDAMNSTECAGLIAAGGLVGGIAGYFIGSGIHRDVRLEVMPRLSPRGSYFTVGMRREISSPRTPDRSKR